MKKKSKVWVFILLVLLLVAVVLILIQCRAPQEQQWNSEYIASSDFSTAASGASSMPSTMTSEQGTTIPSSSAAVTLPPSAPETKPSQGATQPTTPETKPSQPDAEPTKPATSAPTDTSQHSFGEWKWEEYTYTVDYGYSHPGGSQYATYTSHRKYRTCTKCGYKETSGSDHICQKGSDNHTVTTVKAGTCTTKATMRSTCKVCGWYVEYEGKKGDHTVKTETRHLTDYGTYTNELDAVIDTCTSCGASDVAYVKGEGWSDYNRYAVKVSIAGGGDQFSLEHPEYQMVKRNFVYDSDGYVKQFTVYWWYNGTRYSQVIKCDKASMIAWFAEYGLSASGSETFQIKAYGTEIRPYQISWTG